ncbi:hypothetical protein SAMN05518672_11584 [Chitinophaga sp. CF118]|uniref:Imm32 family immunity protein n=1 Tax=Chitinophaga sp. CF118 TaxID=1884367 RepID=UPI0008E7AC57|nr:hypothetical protein [Chitinophaga sp. CF118]SFF07601.1 hypothetical protein SAMN05518672_11584 [Chitinophaga sp. CF118]
MLYALNSTLNFIKLGQVPERLKMLIDIPVYNSQEVLKYIWENNFELKVKDDKNEIVLIANKAGLISLATQLLTLAQDSVPAGAHLHYDENNSLEDGSKDLIIQKA